MIRGEMIGASGAVYRPFETDVIGDIINVFASLQIVQNFRADPELQSPCTFRAHVPKNEIVTELYFTHNGKGSHITVSPEKASPAEDPSIASDYFVVVLPLEGLDPDSVFYFGYDYTSVLTLADNIVSVNLFKDEKFLGCPIRFDIRVEETYGIGSVKTNLVGAEITEVSKTESRIEAYIRDGVNLFAVNVDLYDPYETSFYVEGNDVIVPFMSTVVEPCPSFPRDFAVLIDRSLSMRSFKKMIDSCVCEFVESLPDSCRLEVANFGSKFTGNFGKFAQICDATKASAVNFVHKSKCNMKQSDLLGGISACFAESDDPKVLKTLIVITDSRIERSEETLAVLEGMKSCSRVCVINVSNIPNFAASAANILCFSAPGDQDLREALSQIWSAANDALIMNPLIGKAAFQCITTGVLTPLFLDSAVTVGKKSVVIRGFVEGKPFRQVIPRAGIKRTVPVTVLREFFGMKRRNFITPEYKLTGMPNVMIVVPGRKKR